MPTGTVTVSKTTLYLAAAVSLLLVLVAVLSTLLISDGGASSTANVSSAGAPDPTPTLGPPPTPSPRPPTATPTATASPTPSPTPTAVPVQLLNGQELLRLDAFGQSILTVKNGTTKDALVKLTTADASTTVRTVYVVRQSDWAITGIAPGRYLLRFALGNDWDPVLNRFQKNVSFTQFEEPFDFEDDGFTYTTWEVTLHAIPGGTAETESISAEDFYED